MDYYFILIPCDSAHSEKYDCLGKYPKDGASDDNSKRSHKFGRNRRNQ